VYAASLVETLAALGAPGALRALVVHGADGLERDRHTDAAWLEAGRLRRLRIEPGPLGIELARPEDLRGGDAAENAAIVRAVLAGEPGPRRDIVLLNAAAALGGGRGGRPGRVYAGAPQRRRCCGRAKLAAASRSRA
jgi:anthranilate phosphoribosyltransferase